MDYKQVFSNIYENFGFGNSDSRSGPGSDLEQTETIRQEIKKLIKSYNIKSVVDIPCGDFYWMKEIVFNFDNYIGGDIVENCIKENNERYGNSRIKFINFDLLKDEIPTADLLIVRDIIGHFPISDGIKIVENILKSNCKYLLSTTWYNVEDNSYYKKHYNSGTNLGRFYPVNLMSDPFNFPQPEFLIEEKIEVDNFSAGNRKVLALWDLEKLKQSVILNTDFNSEKKLINKDLTVVTGLWNIGRPGRSFDEYLTNFRKILETDVPMFIYIPKEYQYVVWEKRSPHNTHVRVYELSDIKELYGCFWDKTQEIRTNPDWLNLTGPGGWLKDSPQAVLEWYNPIVMSKYSMLHNVTVWNPFDSKYFIWLDAGITNTVYEKFFTENKVLDKIIPLLDPFLFLSYPYEARDEIHGFKIDAMNKFARSKVEYVCRGGLFGGHIDAIKNGNGLYWHLVNDSLNSGYMGTEESIFTIMSYLEPETFRRYALDENGLVVKFIQALISDTVTLEPIPESRAVLKPKNLDVSNLKTSLYMLTFNFPEQVVHTLETYRKNHPDFLDKTRKILIDNSNKEEAIQGNKQVCEQYGIEHIVTGENLGINRGRQYVANHFNESNSDYYIFLEDDMGVYGKDDEYCRNGFRHYVPNLYQVIHKIMLKEEFDFLKLSYTEVYMDNNIQVSWYNVPQNIRSEVWPEYDKLPTQGLDLNAPRTKFNKINVLDGVSYADGQIYYANWPMIVGRVGNQKMFLDVKWEYPYEQTWMSYMFQETVKGNIKPAVLLASPIHHNRIVYYKPEERREN